MGNPEDIDGPVFVRVFRVGALRSFRFEPSMFLLEGIGDVFQEDQTEHDMLVLGGIHVGSERISGLPQFSLEPEVGSVIGCFVVRLTS